MWWIQLRIDLFQTMKYVKFAKNKTDDKPDTNCFKPIFLSFWVFFYLSMDFQISFRSEKKKEKQYRIFPGIAKPFSRTNQIITLTSITVVYPLRFVLCLDYCLIEEKSIF